MNILLELYSIIPSYSTLVVDVVVPISLSNYMIYTFVTK